MKKSIFLNFFLLIFLIYAGPANARPAPESFADLVAELSPAVVNISTSQLVESRMGGGFRGFPDEMFPPGHPFEQFQDFFNQFEGGRGGNGEGDGDEPRKEKLTSLGSGFIISKEGLIVTNHHVVADSEEITVTLNDESQYEAELVGSDAKTDLAVLRIIQEDKKIDFPFSKFGDSDNARVGDWVIAIGNPFNLGGTVTAGIISARARDINSGPFDDFIQTDAAINRGNSGGPLFDMDGKVIGVNSAIFSPSGGNVGIGFAIPTNLAEPIIKQLKEGKEIKRGWLGVKIQTVTKEIAESLGLKDEKGALVVDIIDASPAEDAGFEKGDVILEFDGKEIPTMRKLPRIVAETEVGKDVDVKVWRKGKMVTLEVDLGRLKEEKQEKPKLSMKKDGDEHKSAKEVLGMKVIKLEDKVRNKYEIDKALEGLLIVDIDQNSAAAQEGIRPGDIISEVNQEKVEDYQDIKKALDWAKKKGRESALFYIVRGAEGLFIALPIED